MKNIKYFNLIIIFVFINLITIKPLNASDVQEVLIKLEQGFNKSSINLFAEYLSENSYISLNNGSEGYFTSGQLYYIFQNYFSKYKNIELKFEEYPKNSQVVSTYGNYKYVFNGEKKTSQLFVTLKKNGDSWLIIQLIIS